MQLLTENSSLWKKAFQIYETGIDSGELLHCHLDLKTWQNKLCQNGIDDLEKIAVASENGTAFAFGCISRVLEKAFVTLILVDRDHRRRGLGRDVLFNLEQQFRKRGFGRFELSFFNPVTFSWTIPGKLSVTHPNTPGVDVGSPAYLFLKNCGYRDFAIQNSYYLLLADDKAEFIHRTKYAELVKKGYQITHYEKEIHVGMKMFLRETQNPMWEREIISEPSISEGGRPILVAVKDRQVCGFAGPLAVERGKRGYFAGIAVSVNCRGLGIAKSLFSSMCMELRDMGAEYMTLFTGENNPARNIYEEAGFSIVRTWADMRKEKEYGE